MLTIIDAVDSLQHEIDAANYQIEHGNIFEKGKAVRTLQYSTQGHY